MNTWASAIEQAAIPASPPSMTAAEASRRNAAIGRAKIAARTRAVEGDLRQRVRDLISARPGLYGGEIADILIEETPAMNRRRPHEILTELAWEFVRIGRRSAYRYYPRTSK